MLIIEYILFGFVTGFISGISPGPLLALAVSETLKGNIKSGILVSLSPIFSDIPVLFLSLWILEKLENLQGILSFISVVGGIFLLYLGIENLKAKGRKVKSEKAGKNPFLKALFINFLSPYTYLFWFFVGAPLVKKTDLLTGFLFLFSYFLGIFSSMFMVVLFTEGLKTFLESRFYTLIIKFTGLVLIIFGLVLINNGIRIF
jgi:threonine/homoserine/homoserine lactone efflux protein